MFLFLPQDHNSNIAPLLLQTATWLISLVSKAPVYRVGGSGLVHGQTNTQGLKIIEEKVLPLL